MNNKFYVNRSSLERFRNFSVAQDRCDFYNTEVEIKIIEPVYEYLVIYKYKRSFQMSSGYYLNEDDFLNPSNGWESSVKFVELYLPSKRERKQ